MPRQLPAPIVVTNPQGFTATTQHDQFGANITPHLAAPLDLWLVACRVEDDGRLTALEGQRSDGLPSPCSVLPTREHYDALTSLPEWQEALGKAAELFTWYVAGRPVEARPDWVPAPPPPVEDEPQPEV